MPWSARRAAGSPGPASGRGSPWPTRRSATWPIRLAIPIRSWPSPGAPSRGVPASDDLALGSYRSLPSPEGTWAFATRRRHRRRPQHVGLVPAARGGRRVDRPGHRPGPGGKRRGGRTHAGGLERGRRRAVTPRRFLLCATPAQGHAVPLLAIAGRLVHDGHQVLFFTTGHYRDRVTATGARFVPLGARVRRPRSDGGQPRPGGHLAARAARGEGGPPGDLPGPPPGQFAGLSATCASSPPT